MYYCEKSINATQGHAQKRARGATLRDSGGSGTKHLFSFSSDL